MRTLLLLSIICLANSSFAEPIIINLLPAGKTVKKEIKLPLEAAELSLTIKSLLSDAEAITAEMKRDKKEHVINLTMTNKIDERTLRALASSLVSLKTLQMKKKNTFKPLKTLVMTYFPNATSSDILKFLLAANFLDINELLRPAAAAWIDQYQKENSGWVKNWLWKLPEGKLSANLPSDLKVVPKELLPLFDDYWHWLHGNPKPIALPFNANASDLFVENNRLFGLNKDFISIFDLKQNRVVKTIPGKGWYLDAKLSGNKLYVADGDSVYIVDVTTYQSKRIPLGAGSVFLSGNRLYVRSTNVINVIDTTTDQDVGTPIKFYEIQLHSIGGVSTAVADMAVANNKLYVSAYGELFVIDLTTNLVVNRLSAVDLKIGRPGNIAASGNKLYIADPKDGKVSVLDVTTDKVIGTIKVGRRPHALSLAGNMLFIGDYEENRISIIDTSTNKVIGEPLKTSKPPLALAFSHGALYVSEGKVRDRTEHIIEYFNVDIYYLQ